MQIVASLQAQLNQLLNNGAGVGGGIPTVDTFLQEGDTVKTTGNVRVRMSPGISGALVRVIPAGSVGEILTSQSENYRNPTVVGGYTWYRVRYESLGVTGWTAGNWLTKISSFETGNDSVSISALAVNKTSLTYGDTLEVTWSQRGSVPQGSQVCFELYSVNKNRSFAFPADRTSCVSVAGAEPEQTISGLIDYTSGYRLEPGTYELRLRLIGPVQGGKDGRSLATKNYKYITVVQNDNEGDGGPMQYDISITSPRPNQAYRPGDIITLRWKQENLDGERGVVTLEGNNTQRQVLQNVNLQSGRAKIRIPVADTLGKVTAGKYQIKLWVSNIKDGDPKGVADTTTIDIVANNTNRHELQAMINELLKQVQAQNPSVNVLQPTGLQNMTEQELQAEIDRLMAIIAEGKTKESVQSPKKNNFACGRQIGTKLGTNALACYGMWDYGNDFGEDTFMCGGYGAGTTGCEIKAPMCASGKAVASTYYTNAQLKSMSESPLSVITRNLQTNSATVKAGVAGLWEYTCTSAGEVSAQNSF